MKKLLLLTISFVPLFVYATSGACSNHGGVNCSVGAGTSGQVVCNDGWDESSVQYSDTSECQTPPIKTNSAFEMKRQCATYTKTIQNEIIDFDVYSEKNEKLHPGNKITSILGEVFYSPVTNSCLYTETVYIKDPGTVINGHVLNTSGTTYSIHDYLDNEAEIYVVSVKPLENVYDSPKVTEFYNMVDYYKGNTPPVKVKTITKKPLPPQTSTSSPSKLLSGFTINQPTSTSTANSVSAPTAPKNVGKLHNLYQSLVSFFKF